MSTFSRLKETVLSHLASSALTLLGISLVGLWSLFQSSVVEFLVQKSPISFFALGWALVLLLGVLMIVSALALYLAKQLRDPFKKYLLDAATRTCIDPKTNIHYCMSCLGNNKKFPIFLIGEEWICTNMDCKNSRPQWRGKQYLE